MLGGGDYSLKGENDASCKEIQDVLPDHEQVIIH